MRTDAAGMNKNAPVAQISSPIRITFLSPNRCMIQPAGRAARKYPPKNANWIRDDSVSVRLKAFFRCGIRMSLRLTPIAHRKKRLVTSVNGRRYRRSVMGADELIVPFRAMRDRDARIRRRRKDVVQ